MGDEETHDTRAWRTETVRALDQLVRDHAHPALTRDIVLARLNGPLSPCRSDALDRCYGFTADQLANDQRRWFISKSLPRNLMGTLLGKNQQQGTYIGRYYANPHFLVHFPELPCTKYRYQM